MSLWDSTVDDTAIDQLADRIAQRLQPAHDDRPLLSINAAAKRLDMSPRTVRDMIAGPTPRLASIKVEGSRKIEPAVVDQYLDGLRGAA